MKGRLLALACAFAPAWAVACSFANLEHEVQFAPSSTRLASQEIISLTNWFVGQRSTSNATGGIYSADVFAAAIKGDAASSMRARRRLAEIAGLLKTLSTTATVDVQTHVEELERQSIRHPERLDFLDAGVQPACAKTGSCCKGSAGVEAAPKQQ